MRNENGENQIYKKESKISKLPQYMFVNMQRFFWKKDSSTAGTKAGKTKILRNVSFPLVLDVYENCTEELKTSLKLGRDYEIKQRLEEDERVLSGKAIEEEKKTKDKVKPDLINDAHLY